MEQLIYTSVAAENIDAGDLFQIVQHATQRNVERDLTGVLTFAHGHFFQAVEGPSDQVSALMAALERDSRHHSIKILKHSKILRRQFNGWQMKRVKVSDVSKARRVFHNILAENDDALTILNEYDNYLSLPKVQNPNQPSSKAARPSSPTPCSLPSKGAPSL